MKTSWKAVKQEKCFSEGWNKSVRGMLWHFGVFCLLTFNPWLSLSASPSSFRCLFFSLRMHSVKISGFSPFSSRLPLLLIFFVPSTCFYPFFLLLHAYVSVVYFICHVSRFILQSFRVAFHVLRMFRHYKRWFSCRVESLSIFLFAFYHDFKLFII